MMPFIDLKAQQARIASELRRRLDGVLAHCQFILGPEVAELESELASAKVLQGKSSKSAGNRQHVVNADTKLAIALDTNMALKASFKATLEAKDQELRMYQDLLSHTRASFHDALQELKTRRNNDDDSAVAVPQPQPQRPKPVAVVAPKAGGVVAARGNPK